MQLLHDATQRYKWRLHGLRGRGRFMLTAAAHALFEELEGALLGHIAHLLELLNSLEASGMLLTAHNATGLRLHEVLLGQATGSVFGASMVHLGFRANGATIHHAIFTCCIVLAFCHFGF